MKFSRFYESALILLIIFLFLHLVVTSGNLISLSKANTGINNIPATSNINNKLQISHPELLIGPVDGNWTENNYQLIEDYQSTLFTTTNYCFQESEPLAPTGVVSNAKNMDGVYHINSPCYSKAVFQFQNGLMFIEGDIIN